MTGRFVVAFVVTMYETERFLSCTTTNRVKKLPNLSLRTSAHAGVAISWYSRGVFSEKPLKKSKLFSENSEKNLDLTQELWYSMTYLSDERFLFARIFCEKRKP